VLSYITGGLAYGEVKINGTNTVSGFVRACGCDATGFSWNNQTFGQSHLNTGWVIGFGTEGKTLIPGLTYKIESLYMDLGTLDTASVIAPPLDRPGGQVTMTSHFTDWILRAGLNYQFH
jgi:opacity protein-like surface antigen